MPRSIKLSLRRRIARQRMIAITVSVLLHVALLAPWAARKMELGDEGGAVAVSLMPRSEPAPSSSQPPTVATKAREKREGVDAPKIPDTPDEATSPSPPELAAGLNDAIEPPPLIEISAEQVDASAQAAARAEEAALESVAAFMAKEMAARAGQPGQGCKIAEWLKQALQDSAEVEAALARVPRQARSVANALMLWDGAWVTPAPSAAAGMASVRRAIVAGVQTAPTQCLNEPVRGPLLIPIIDDGDTLTLAIGSGVWRWADLLDETGLGQAAEPLS